MLRCPVPFVVGIALAAVLGGCAATPQGRHSVANPRQISATNLPPGPVLRTGADSVQMLHGGRWTFPLLVGLVDGARHNVEVEMYEFGRADMAAALIRARQRGIAVTVIVDPGVDVTAATASRLRAADVDVVDYPLRPRMIDHVKLLLVDGDVGVIGGINWGAQSERNHDVDAVVRGPAVTNLERVFRRDLVSAGRHADIPAPAEDAALLVVTTLPGADIRPLVLSVIDGATTTLDLELYVITDMGVVAAIDQAVARGVRVRVLLDPSERPSDGAAAQLRRGGAAVRIYASSGEKLHAKFAVADGRTVIFGSANWSAGGFAHNHECDVEITDSRALATDFEAAVDADWNASG